jgi:hypothetical protein
VGAKFRQDYNALCGAISPKPLGTATLVPGQWYFCPGSKNVFEYAETRGGFKDGKVVLDLDLNCIENDRASPGDAYHCKSTKSADYHEVTAAVRSLLSLPTLYPTLFKALSGLTVAMLKARANKEFTSPSSSACGATPMRREDLVGCLLLTAAKRHAANSARSGLEALKNLCPKEAQTNLAAADQGALGAEWTALIQACVDRDDALAEESEGKVEQSPADVADFDRETAATPTAAELESVKKQLEFAAAEKEQGARKGAEKAAAEEVKKAATEKAAAAAEAAASKAAEDARMLAAQREERARYSRVREADLKAARLPEEAEKLEAERLREASKQQHAAAVAKVKQRELARVKQAERDKAELARVEQAEWDKAELARVKQAERDKAELARVKQAERDKAAQQALDRAQAQAADRESQGRTARRTARRAAEAEAEAEREAQVAGMQGMQRALDAERQATVAALQRAAEAERKHAAATKAAAATRVAVSAATATATPTATTAATAKEVRAGGTGEVIATLLVAIAALIAAAWVKSRFQTPEEGGWMAITR